MGTIVLFDPSQGTRNLGDYIIRDAINYEMQVFFKNNYIVRYSTHTPISRWYQLLKPGEILKCCKNAEYKFLCGTNLFKSTLVRFNSDWNIGISSIPYYRGAVAIGCGYERNSKICDVFTRWMYKRILSKKYIHSTRDERTKEFLESLGFCAINTGCPTMWGLTEEHCKKIPSRKAEKVVFTLTDYSMDPEKDKELLRLIRSNYKEVFFWPQGCNDCEYLQKLIDINDIVILQANLESFENILLQGNIDYVGTRLHAGIYAMQKCVRSIILALDNRSLDIKKTYNIPVVNRNDNEELDRMINSEFIIDLGINASRIEEWKKQFEVCIQLKEDA